MAITETKLWRKDPITGYWKLARTCDIGTAHQWLLVFQKDEPDVTFKLSPKRPAD
jgi:hypothetical protein